MAEATALLNESSAIALIEALDKPQPAGEAAASDPDAAAAAEIDAHGAPETEGSELDGEVDGAETEGNGEEGTEDAEGDVEPAAAGPIEAPAWWDAEAKAAFADIPNTPAARDYARRIQQYVAEAETKREAITQRAKSTAETHTAELTKMKSLTARLDGAAPGEIENFHRDYGDIDWASMPKWAQENPAEATTFFAEYNARRARVESLVGAKAEAEKLAADAYAREQGARLQAIAPDMASSPEVFNLLGQYAQKTGIPAEAYKNASADELVILNKARLWDEAQAKAAAAAKAPKPGTSPAPKSVKPVAAPTNGTHAQRTYAAARDKAMKSRSDDDAVAAILAGGF
jgi:hypothetical protein